MVNTSATGGYLDPTLTTPSLDDDALTDFFQEIIVGVSGLPGDKVFPRWQEDPPELPEFGVDWAAVGVNARRANFSPAVEHHPDGDGYDELIRQEEIDVLISFYGPSAASIASRFRDGMHIAQNREPLLLTGMALAEAVGDFTRSPELIFNRWLNRIDATMVIRRVVTRRYSVLNLLQVIGELKANPPWGSNRLVQTPFETPIP
jgi:hypothetical protein